MIMDYQQEIHVIVDDFCALTSKPTKRMMLMLMLRFLQFIVKKSGDNASPPPPSPPLLSSSSSSSLSLFHPPFPLSLSTIPLSDLSYLMWPPWNRSPRREITTTATVPSSPAASPFHPSFTSISFKDVSSLFSDDLSFSSSLPPIAPKKTSIFHRVRVATSALRSWRSLPTPDEKEKRIVLYFTSLRVVRKTFEDCRTVRSILRGFRVAVDERDLSMDSRFLNELKGILGKRQLALPRVFIGGRYMGGAEEIRQLHEIGELKKFVEGVPPAESGVCESCGGIRFLLCQNCNGSRKFYSEKGGFRSCTSCNENGLVRCSDCCQCDDTF